MEIYIAKNKTQMGPYDAGQVKQMLEAGILEQYDLYWHEGMLDWAPVAVLKKQSSRPPLMTETTNRPVVLPKPQNIPQNNQGSGANMNGLIAGAILLNSYRNNQIHEDLRELNHNIHDSQSSSHSIDEGTFDEF